MANVIIHSDEQKRDTDTIMKQFYAPNTKENREHAEAIARYYREAEKRGDFSYEN